MFFFIMGISGATKQIGAIPNVVCPSCGASTQLQVISKYNVFNLFCIPIFKWKRQYYAAASCCNVVFEIDPEQAKAFERGKISTIDSAHLHKTEKNSAPASCPYCGAELPPNARYCYMCGMPL